MIALLASVSLMAADKVETSKAGASTSTNIDGAAVYKKRCSVCHGEKGEKTPLSKMIPITGMDAGALARKVRAFRDQEERHGAYAIYEDSQVMREATYSLSDQHISAIATYISGLK